MINKLIALTPGKNTGEVLGVGPGLGDSPYITLSLGLLALQLCFCCSPVFIFGPKLISFS